jgi:hypothetical protein
MGGKIAIVYLTSPDDVEAQCMDASQNIFLG